MNRLEQITSSTNQVRRGEWHGVSTTRQTTSVDIKRPMSNSFMNPWLASERLAIMLLPITGIAVAVALLPIGASQFDMVTFFVPWMNVIQERGLASLSSEFSGYP